MVVQFTMRTHGLNQAFRFVEGIRLHRKSRQIRKKTIRKRSFLHHTCTTCHELSSYISTMVKWHSFDLLSNFLAYFFNGRWENCPINFCSISYGMGKYDLDRILPPPKKNPGFVLT